MKIRKWLLIGAAAGVAILLLTGLTVKAREAAAARRQLHETTLHALTECAYSLEKLTSCTEKLLLSSSGRQAASLLGEAMLHAERARSAFGALPFSEEGAAVMSWLWDTGEVFRTHHALLLSGSGGTEEARGDITERLSALRRLTAEIDLARQDLLGGSDALEALQHEMVTASPSPAELVAYRALPSLEIGPGRALQVAREFVGEHRVVQVIPAPGVSGALPVYGVTITTHDITLNLEITQRGGKVLLMSPESADFPIRKTEAECEEAAARFLQQKGFASMKPIWQQVYSGLCVTTFIHEQNGVLVLSDRVTVQNRMDTAEVVGLEARSYWQHHYPRKIASPLLARDEAAALLSPAADVTNARLCLLPQGSTERLAWQFAVEALEESYLIYIDAITGSELLVEKIMQLDGGTLPA